MFKQCGIVLLILVLLIVGVTLFAPTIFDAVDPRFGSAIMVAVFIIALVLWLNRRRIS